MMAYGQFRAAAKVLNSSISTDCEGPRPRVAKCDRAWRRMSLATFFETTIEMFA